jgi:hypothetical protein
VIPDWLSLIDNGNGTASLSGTPDQTGNFKVKLKASDGWSETIREFIIDVASFGIYEPYNVDVKLYPVPFKHILTIDLNVEAEVKIYSSAGKQIGLFYLDQTSNKIDLSAYPSGLYYCILTFGNNQKTYKTIKY